ncbi:MAG: Phthalate 4,5-dioxygenase [Proteobacteria bacterium]|nr:Phthalate 4,5-dioxygenase [Pseudomonadota bacterium]
MTQQTIKVSIRGIRIEAEHIRSFELVATDGAALPAWQAGAHVQVTLPNSIQRAYSLCNHLGEHSGYRIAVKLEAQSRGGSRAMHALQVGQTLQISAPRNLFELDPSAQRHVLLAGGIGITPLYAMCNALQGMAACELHYFVRHPDQAAFLDRLGDQVVLHTGLDAAHTERTLADLVAHHADAPRTTFYTCGPSPFMAAVETALRTAKFPIERLRSERFSAEPPAPGYRNNAFHIVFAKSGIEADVPPGIPIIQVARECGVDIPTSCEQGVCGACLSEVLEGAPDHLDAYLSDAERTSGKLMLPCVSRCTGKTLVLNR